MYEWIIGSLAVLDQAVKKEIEREEDAAFPRDLPCARGWIRIHKNHNPGFPFGVMKENPDLVKGIPALTASAVLGALGMLLLRKGSRGRRSGCPWFLPGQPAISTTDSAGGMWWTISASV